MRTMSGLLLLAIGAGALGSPAAAGAGGRPAARVAQDVDVEEQVLAVLDEYQEAMRAFYEALSAAESDEAREALFQEKYPQAQPYAERLWKIVEAHPAHPASGEALAWIYQWAGDPDGRAEALLLEHHLGSEHIEVLCFAYVQRTSGAREPLERILEGATSPKAKGLAMLCLGQHLLAFADRAEEVQAMTEDQRTLVAQNEGDDAVIEWMDCDPEAVRADAVAMLEDVEREYAEVAHPYGGTLGASAGGFLFEMRHLQVGMIAPDIEGDDLSGVPFKLSDYRGKVVVLDFWGNW